jgi:5'-methylthioadenosine phosphorylase
MSGLAVVGGNATEGIDLGGAVWTAIERHGLGEYVLPHRIDHVANMRRAVDAGCDRVLGICSVGGAQPQFGPGTFACPDDFISLGPSPTALEGRAAHTVPGIDDAWRGRVLEQWAEAAEPPLVDGATYWQSIGPRLETAAEVRLIAQYADLVGMTMASEWTAAKELGLAYAAICVVVNYANGVGEESLTMPEVEAGQAETRERLRTALDAVLPLLAEQDA